MSRKEEVTPPAEVTPPEAVTWSCKQCGGQATDQYLVCPGCGIPRPDAAGILERNAVSALSGAGKEKPNG